MRCLFFDCPVTSRVDRPTQETLSAALRTVGGNTGNILFRYGIASSILDELTACHWRQGQGLAMSQDFDAVILGAANWLNIYHDNGNQQRARILRSINKPTLCVGLGVQSPSRTSRKLDFPPGALDFLNVLRDLEATVLVRDEFTYDQCVHYGLTRLAVVGCPSNFIDVSREQVDTLASKSGSVKKLDKITLNYGYARRDIQIHDSAILQSVLKTSGVCIVQDDLSGGIQAALAAEGLVVSAFEAGLRRVLAGFTLDAAIKYDIAQAWKRLRVYFSAPEWIDALKSSTLVLGTRIHGCIAALQAGTPSVITTIDSRTEGLAETLGIPRVSISRLNLPRDKADVSTILAYSGLDYAPYFRRRQQLLRDYMWHLSDFGLTISPRLKRSV